MAESHDHHILTMALEVPASYKRDEAMFLIFSECMPVMSV